MNHVLNSMMRLMRIYLQFLQQSFRDWTKPSTTSLLLGTLTDLPRSKSALVAENALLRQQLIILSRQIKRPVSARRDRILLVLLARMVRTWKHALLLVQEDDGPAASIARDFNCIGSTRPEQWLPNRRSPRRPWR
jgi:putative transposase